MRLRSIFYFLMMILPAGHLFAQNFDPITDFRGLEWGTPVEAATLGDMEAPDFDLVATVGQRQTYQLANDDLKIGTVLLEKIYYFFHEEAGFYKVILVGQSNQNDEMDALLVNRLGDKFETLLNATNAHMIWSSKNGVYVDYEEQMSEDFSLTIESDTLRSYLRGKNRSIDDF